MALEGEREISPEGWVREQTEKILDTGTTEGVTIYDRPIVLVTIRGAKTDKLRYTPLMRVEHDGCYALVASKGGSPENPLSSALPRLNTCTSDCGTSFSKNAANESAIGRSSSTMSTEDITGWPGRARRA